MTNMMLMGGVGIDKQKKLWTKIAWCGHTQGHTVEMLRKWMIMTIIWMVNDYVAYDYEGDDDNANI